MSAKGRDPMMRRKFRAALDAVAVIDQDMAADIDEWHEIVLARMGRLSERALRAEGTWKNFEDADEKRAERLEEAIDRVLAVLSSPDRELGFEIVSVLLPELAPAEVPA